MEFVAVALAVLAVFVAWLVTTRPEVPKKIGRACVNGLYAAGEWYAAPYEEMTEAMAQDDSAKASDPSGSAETAVIARLLEGAISRADYHAAMAELALLDADRHPISIPPLPDR